MSLALLKRSSLSRPITAAEHDTNLTAIEDESARVAKPAPRTTATSTPLAASDNGGGIVGTAACTVTVDTATNLGAGFCAPVVADGGTLTLAGLSGAVSIPSGQSVVVEVRNGKRWVYGPSSPAVTPS